MLKDTSIYQQTLYPITKKVSSVSKKYQYRFHPIKNILSLSEKNLTYKEKIYFLRQELMTLLNKSLS